MACGNNHVSRGSVGHITIQGRVDPVAEAAPAGLAPVIVKWQENPRDKTGDEQNGVHRYVDDRGRPRTGNIYPHIHHGPDPKQDTYFVQASRAPRGWRVSYGPTAHLDDPFDAHPPEERIVFNGSNRPDPGLLEMAIDLVGALLRGDSLE